MPLGGDNRRIDTDLGGEFQQQRLESEEVVEHCAKPVRIAGDAPQRTSIQPGKAEEPRQALVIGCQEGERLQSQSLWIGKSEGGRFKGHA